VDVARTAMPAADVNGNNACFDCSFSPQKSNRGLLYPIAEPLAFESMEAKIVEFRLEFQGAES
jgi:hypothetical protein